MMNCACSVANRRRRSRHEDRVDAETRMSLAETVKTTKKTCRLNFTQKKCVDKDLRKLQSSPSSKEEKMVRGTCK